MATKILYACCVLKEMLGKSFSKVMAACWMTEVQVLAVAFFSSTPQLQESWRSYSLLSCAVGKEGRIPKLITHSCSAENFTVMHPTLFAWLNENFTKSE
jgi:hypothetical protein